MQFTSYALLMLSAGVLGGWISVYSWRHREKRSAQAFSVMSACAAWWATCYGLQLLFPIPDVQWWIHWAMMPGVYAVPPLWMRFVLLYTERPAWASWQRLWPLAVIAVAMLGLNWTNGAHHLIYREVEMLWELPAPKLRFHTGPLNYAYLLYTYLIFGTSFGLIVWQRARSSTPLRKRQATLMIIGGIVPIVINAATYFGGLRVFFDLTPLTFNISGAIYLYSLFFLEFFDLMPVAQHTIVENLRDAVFVLDVKGQVADLNPAARRLLGHRAHSAIGQPLSEVLPQLPPEAHDQDALVAITWDEGDGRVRYFEAEQTRLQDPKGNRAGALLVLHDVTVLRENAIALEQARLTAEAATKAKSNFLASMSHEIRTPMNGVIGMTSLLMDTSLEADQREYVETIHTSGESLLTIINDILDFSKVEAGKLEVEAAPFDLYACVEDALGLMAARVADAPLVVLADIAPDVPHRVVGDVTRVRQVLVNLLSNAVKFTAAGEVTVHVTAAAAAASAPGALAVAGTPVMIEVAVRDTGIGISEDRMQTLFQPFVQAEADTTRRFGGTGLGLAISRQLCRLMGGEVWAESTLGQGSTFSFSFAATPVPTSPLARLALPAGQRVLVAVSHPATRTYVEAYLNRWGFRAVSVPDGKAAVAALQQGTPVGLVLADRCLPGLPALSKALAAKGLGGRTVVFTPMGASTLVSGATAHHEPVRFERLRTQIAALLAPPEPVRPCTQPCADRPAREPSKLPLRILLAEDNLVNQKVAKRLLDRMGYSCTLATNGLQVLDALRGQDYDVVLMDVQMPHMDGLEATRHIVAEWPAARRPRIIAMTANAMDGDREHCLEAGMDDYVSKPIRRPALQAALDRAHAHQNARVDGQGV